MLIAGVDEVGRGSLAGPVIASAVILQIDKVDICDLKDSKKLTPRKRVLIAEEIKKKALNYSYGRADVAQIDEINIHHATLLAMKRAIEALTIKPDKILIDGIYLPRVNYSCYAITKGDELIAQISAASILAKVHRDTEMIKMDDIYPGYEFPRHKGYATKLHIDAIYRLGITPIHRKKFVQKINKMKEEVI